MTEPIAQFQNEIPILPTTPIDSGAEGYESIGKAFRALSQTATNEIQYTKDLKNNSLYLSGASSAYDIEQQAKAQLNEHPEIASQIRNTAINSLQTIAKTTDITGKDKNRLISSVNMSASRIGYNAEMARFNYAKDMASYNIFSGWKETLDNLAQSVGTTHFNDLHNAATKQLDEAFKGGVLSPDKYYVLHEQLKHVMDNQILAHSSIGKDISALDLNTMAANPYSTLDKSALPINGNTDYIQRNFTMDLTLNTLKTNLVRGEALNPMAIGYLKPEQTNELYLYGMGVQKANGVFNNGENYAQIVRRSKQLNNKEHLTESERGEFERYQHIQNAFGYGDYSKLILSTPSGMRIENEFRDEAKTGNYNLALNNRITKLAKYGIATGIDSHLIKPIPEQITQATQSSFDPGGNPETAINSMAMLTPENRVYLADAMKKPEHQEVTYLVGSNHINLQDKADLILSNQTGLSLDAIKNTSKLEHDLAASIYAPKITFTDKAKNSEQAYDAMKYLSLTSQNRQTPIFNALTNYVKFQAIRNNDFDLKHSKEYIDKAISLLGNGFDIKKGDNYIFNSLPITDKEAKKLAIHIIDTAYVKHYGEMPKSNIKEELNDFTPGTQAVLDKIKNPFKGTDISDEIAYKKAKEAFLSSNPIMVYNTPDNKIIAQDAKRTIYYAFPFTAGLISHANH
jgi:hypothetical protein